MMRKGQDLKTGQQGDVNLAMLALTLPILLALFAAGVDLARVPLTRRSLYSAMVGPAYDTQLPWSAGEVGIEPFTPAAHNFCEVAGGEKGSCTTDGTRLAYINSSDIYNAFLAKLCSDAANNLASGLGFLAPARSDMSIKCSLVSIASNADGTPDAAPFASEIASVSYPDNDGAVYSELASASGLTNTEPLEIAEAMGSYIKATPTLADVAVTVAGRGGYSVDLCAATGTCNMSASWRDSYWIVMMGYVRLTSTFGSFALLGGTSASDNDVYVVSKYIIRPIEAVAGIQPAVSR